MNSSSDNYNGSIALFDFDGTITTRDTFIAFIIFTHGILKFLLGFFLLSPYLLLYKFRLVPNHKAKEAVLRLFFKGWTPAEMKAAGERFSIQKLPSLLREKALEKIRWHRQEGHTVVVVSASIGEWILPWSSSEHLLLIATQLEVAEGKITGRLGTKNCYGPEKVCRIRQLIDIENFSNVYAYGDSRGDLEMLELSSQPQYKPFRN